MTAVIIPSLPNNLTNGTTADATQVMANFSAIVSAVNANSANAGVNTNITSLTGLTTALGAAQGGTGLLTLPANGVLIGEGVNPVAAATPGAAGTCLVSNGVGVDPSFGCPYHVGDLYITTLSANPVGFYPGTTWAAYAAGQVLIGVGSFTDANGTNKVITGGLQSGEYNHTLSTPEMPSHTHTDNGHTHNSSVGTSNKGGSGNGNCYSDNQGGSTIVGSGNPGGGTQAGFASLQNTGGGGAHNNMQPSIGVYIWQRLT